MVQGPIPFHGQFQWLAAILMKDVACVRNEENIKECSSTYLSLSDGKVLTDEVVFLLSGVSKGE